MIGTFTGPGGLNRRSTASILASARARLSANALSILKDPETLARFRKGAARSAERFDIAKVLPRYEALYQQVVDQVKANGVHQ